MYGMRIIVAVEALVVVSAMLARTERDATRWKEVECEYREGDMIYTSDFRLT